jgi:hypothetical protein
VSPWFPGFSNTFFWLDDFGLLFILCLTSAVLLQMPVELEFSPDFSQNS